METIEKERLKTRRELEKDHPLNRKFSSLEEFSKAKTEYVMSDIPESVWDDLERVCPKAY